MARARTLAARIGCGAALALLAASAAQAGYLGDRAGWNQLSDDQKIAYAMAVYDTSNIAFGGDSPETVAVKQGRVRCLAERRLSADDLVTWLDQAYAADPGKGPPSTTLIGAVSEHCQRQIEDERIRMKAVPLRP